MTGPLPIDLQEGSAGVGGSIVLHDVSLQIHPGEFVVLLGTNGSGKTTLIRTLLGLTPLLAGSLLLFGTPLARFREWRRVGYVPQRFTATTGVPATVEEAVLAGRLAVTGAFGRRRPRDHDAASAALEAVDLLAFRRRPVGALSGGQQQRVLIARALAGEPDLLLLDEPVSGVDIEHQESFAGTLALLKEQGRSILLVAHALGMLAPLVERAVVLAEGRVVYDGDPLPEQEHAPHEHHHPHEDDAGRTP